MGLVIKFIRMPLAKKSFLMIVMAVTIYGIMRPTYIKEGYTLVRERARLGWTKTKHLSDKYIFRRSSDDSRLVPASFSDADLDDDDSLTLDDVDQSSKVDDDYEDDPIESMTKHNNVLDLSIENKDMELGYNLNPSKKAQVKKSGKKMNVLFLIADDLRPQIGAYFGRDYATPYDKRKLHTPNLDQLAESSLVLKRAYVQYSLCGPSRASMLTSRRPDTTKVYQNFVHWRESGGNFTTIPQYFKQHGYASIGIGKVFHVDGHKDKDDSISWTVPPFHAPHVRHVTTAGVNWASVSEIQREKEPLEDEITVMHATKTLRKLAPKALSGEKPFFMALGFYRPHVPQICPAEFFKLYPVESKSRFMAEKEWQTPKLDPYCNMAPLQKGSNNSDLTNIPEDSLRELRAAYFACVSYVDYLIGSVLRTLKELDLVDSTIVSVVADHGFHLGENNWYSKYTSYDIALHVPLIIRIPGRTEDGIESRSLVEALDIFPTLAEAAGLPKPKHCPEESSSIKLCTEGRSLLQLINHPQKPIRTAAFSQVARGRDYTEYSVRTERYRYTDFARHTRTEVGDDVYKHQLTWDVNTEYSDLVKALYDHDKDPEERVNVVNDPDYKTPLTKLRDRLQQKFNVVEPYPQAVYDAYA